MNAPRLTRKLHSTEAAISVLPPLILVETGEALHVAYLRSDFFDDLHDGSWIHNKVRSRNARCLADKK